MPVLNGGRTCFPHKASYFLHDGLFFKFHEAHVTRRKDLIHRRTVDDAGLKRSPALHVQRRLVVRLARFDAVHFLGTDAVVVNAVDGQVAA